MNYGKLSTDPTHGKQADPYQVKEYWTKTVREAADKGKLEKIPTKLAKTKRERAQAQAQNQQITRKSFGGFGENYDLIEWESPA